MIALRPYQAELIARIVDAFNSGIRTAVMQLGTGGGKTASVTALLARAVSKGIRCLFLAHLDTLITDTAERLREAGIACGFVQAGRAVDPDAPVQVGSMQTLHVRGVRPPAGLVVIDECHRTMADSVRGIVESYPEAWILGLTATPQRADGKALGNVYQALFCGPSNRWLTDAGYLAPCEVIAAPEFLDKGVCEDPIAAYEREAPGSRAIVFVSTIDDARKLASRFEARGHRAAVLLGETSRADRARLIDSMRGSAGEGHGLQILIGVGVFLEGFDLPCIETVILARGLTVTGAFLQAIGRGRRISEGKTRCLVIDLCGSVWLHGLPDDDRAWSITGRAVRRVDLKTPLKRCKACLAIFKVAVACPRCGARGELVVRGRLRLTRTEKLARLDDIAPEKRDERYLSRLLFVAKTRVRSADPAAWALAKFRKQFGRDPLLVAEKKGGGT